MAHAQLFENLGSDEFFISLTADDFHQMTKQYISGIVVFKFFTRYRVDRFIFEYIHQFSRTQVFGGNLIDELHFGEVFYAGSMC